eukprot:gene27095-32738_t
MLDEFDIVTKAELEQAAYELRDYLIFERRGLPINAGRDYDLFRRNVASAEFEEVINRTQIKPKSLVLRFPNVLWWEQNNHLGARGTNFIHPVAPEAKPGAYFATSEEGFSDVILNHRSRLLADNRFVVNNRSIADYELKWGYNILASQTARLSGVLSTAPAAANYFNLKEAIKAVLANHPNESMRGELSQVEVFCFLRKSVSISPEALCYFTLVHPSKLHVAKALFDYLIFEVIHKGHLRLCGSTLTLEERRRPSPWPWAPHMEALDFIPYMVQTRLSVLMSQGLVPSENDVTEDDQPQGELSGDGLVVPQSSPTPTVTPPPDTASSLPRLVRRVGPATASPPATTAAAAASAPVTPPLPLPREEDMAKLFPEPYGYLEEDLASPVVDQASLAAKVRERAELFEQLKFRVTDSSDPRTMLCLSFRQLDEGTFVLYKHTMFLLGKGSEASVYLGGYLAGEYASDDLEVVKRNFSAHAQPVAIKHYNSYDNKIEINTFRRLPRGVDGIINYLASYDVGEVELYTVQELGLVSLDKVVRTAPLQDRLKMIRGASLAVRELHRRTGGPIVHRDIRLPNFLLTETGCIKICDFGISRILGDTKRTVRTQGRSMAFLNYQPHEVQVVVAQMIENMEEEAKVLDGDDENSEQKSENHFFVPVSTSADIFMLGLVLYKLATKVEAFSNKDILNHKGPNFGMFHDLFPGGPLLAHLLSCMLSHDPAARPTIEQVLDHPFFKSWNENKSIVDVLYRELHDQNGVRVGENFLLLESMLRTLEASMQEIDWAARRQILPVSVQTHILNSARTPHLLYADGRVLPHSLPNIHGAVQWLRHFYTHFHDTRTLVWVYHDLLATVKEGAALGEFVYVHPTLAWILPGLWEMRMKYHQELKAEKDDLDRKWEELQRQNDEKNRELRLKDRKVRALFTLSA